MPLAPRPDAAANCIILVGMPGSGKSTVGRQLSKRLGLPFYDSDHVIEQRIGCSIRSFFEREGEEAFREVEGQVIAELCAQKGVIATGGGAVLRPSNREQLRAAGRVFYLCSTPEDLVHRMRHDKTRPLLQVADPLARLRELFDQRDPLYRETAHFVIEATRPSVSMLVSMVLARLRQAGSPPRRP